MQISELETEAFRQRNGESTTAARVAPGAAHSTRGELMRKKGVLAAATSPSRVEFAPMQGYSNG